MSFVDNDGVIRFKQRIPLRLSKENAIRHQLDGSARSRLICESNLVAHHVAQRRFEFFSDTLGNGARSDSARLRMTDAAGFTSSCHQADLRELRRFTRPRFTADDDDLILFNRLDNIGCAFRNRQPRHEFKRRNGITAFCPGEFRTS